jgi:hypothetical protein
MALARDLWFIGAMKHRLNLLLIACVTLTLLACTGCEKKGPMERTGEKIDNAAEKTGDEMKKAADKTKDAAKEAADKAAEAVDKAKE